MTLDEEWESLSQDDAVNAIAVIWPTLNARERKAFGGWLVRRHGALTERQVMQILDISHTRLRELTRAALVRFKRALAGAGIRGWRDTCG